MRKSFTRLFSVLVLLLLSIQMVIATPTLKTSGGLSPSDGGVVTVVAGTAPVFTLNFQAAVTPGEGQIIGLYNNALLEFKAIQLRAVDKTINGSVITYNHADGVVTFNGSVVTVQFKDVAWTQGVSYWITVGPSAVKDATGNFDAATAFTNSKWEFTIKDTVEPYASKLYPADDATEVPVAYRPLAIKFNEDVKVASPFACSGTLYPSLGDIAVYYSTDSSEITFQEGGDLFSLPMTLDGPILTFWNDGVQVSPTPLYAYPCGAFDSIAINLEQSSLPSHAYMYVRVKKGLFEDLSGNAFAGINDNFKWNFSTKDDDFAIPTITATSNPLCPESNFKIDFANSEVLYLASTNKALVNGQNLASIVKFSDKNGAPVAAAVTFTLATAPDTNTIVINPTVNMTSALAPYKVEIAAGVIKDKSSNPSKAKSVTFNAGNWDAPLLDTAYVVNQSGTTFDIKIATNEPATVHYIVVRSDRKTVPTLAEVFGGVASATGKGRGIIDNVSTADVYYRVASDSTFVNGPDPLPTPPAKGKDLFYGKQTSTTTPITFELNQIFAEGDINIPTANFEVLERVKGLPATHGVQDDPQAKYEVYFAMFDTIGVNNCTGPTSWYVENKELLSPLQTLTQNVYTTNILMPEAWFDGDSATFTSAKPIKLNKDKENPVDLSPSELQDLARNGKIYINFNEEIRDNDGTELTAAEIKEGLFVYTGAAAPSTDANSDVSWSSNHDFAASLSADKKQIIIESGVSWPSSSHVWVKIKNSRFEDIAGNEIVPYGDLYTQEYIVEDYIAPLVRYTYGTIYNPLDSLTKVKYLNYKDGEYTAAPIVVTISDKIYVGQGMNYPKGSIYTNTTKSNLVQFTSNPSDDQFIGNFFKIRNGVTTANAGTSDPLELTDFDFAIDYTYGDSTKITITPKKQYASEYWYYIEIDNRIQDENFLTIAQGASVLEANKPAGFGWTRAYTGNAIEAAGWLKSVDPDTYAFDDNATIVFQAEDSRNPVLTFFSKQREDGIAPWTGTPINDIDSMTGIALTDTIGVYIDEYVGLGFDHYVHFDTLTSTYTLDANAMRRYFKLFDGDSVAMNFDIVGLDTTALANDTLIFYIDPYYVDGNGQALTATETKNFAKNTKYTAYFNSIDDDDQGTEDVSGKTKGIYWDDNNNLIFVTWAQFTTEADVTPDCVSAVITPAPGATNVNPANVQYITLAFNFASQGAIPYIAIQPGTSTVTTIAGQLAPGNSNIVRYPVTLAGSTTYTIAAGTGTLGAVTLGGQDTINSGVAANVWPLEACNANADSTWTFTTLDATAPQLDTATVDGAFAIAEWIFPASTNFDEAEYGTNFLNPTDDSQGFDKTHDMVMVFDEEVVLVSGKAISIYNSARNKVATIYAQNCKYGVGANNKTDKHVIIIPSAYFATALTYTTNYHINVDAGFVTDATGNPWAGILAEDVTADVIEDGDNDWSFQTGADPAPYFAEFITANGIPAVTNLQVQFSEPVNANAIDATIGVYRISSNGSFVVRSFPSSDVNYITPNASKTIWTINAAALPLVADSQYYVTIAANAFTDSNGSPLVVAATQGTIVHNVAVAQDQTIEAGAQWWVRFADDVAPSVLKTWPRDNYEHVPYNAYIYIQFNEAVQFSDGSAIIPDPNPDQLIKRFITVQAGASLLAAANYDVEFVGNDKRMLRITPKDPAGYQYNSTTNNPTMQPATVYTVTINDTDGTYYIADAAGNLMGAAGDYVFDFETEDIKAPVISAGVVNSISCDNKVSYSVTVTDESDTAVVYYAVMPLSTTTAPSATAIFSQNVTGAVKVGKFGVDAMGAASTVTIDLGTNFDENPSFKIYAVASDLEVDVWKPASSAWDSLFMFAGSYGEGYDRILDIMPAPNKSGVSTFVPSVTVWDNDAPSIVGSYPVIGETAFPVGDSVRFWFDEAVVANQVAANIPDSIYLRRFDNNIAVSAAITWVTTGADADSAFYIKPSEELAQETKYYVEFDRYAIQDTAGVCAGNTVYFPQMIGRGFWFQTVDNKPPTLKNHIPAIDATCVACPNLNKDGDEYISVFFYDNNEIRVNSAAADQYVRLYRAEESTVNAWDVIPSSLITIYPGTNDTTWEARIPLHHTYYSNDEIHVVIPGGLIEDIYNNAYASEIAWNYTTCNTDAPAVTTSIFDLSGYFNYSEASSSDNGIYGRWNLDYDKDNAIGSVINDVPTHIALKVDFGEDVEINTSTTTTAKWEALSTYAESNSSTNLTSTELMKALNISGLKYIYGTTFATASDIRILSVTSSSVVFGFRNASNAKLPVYQLLADADAMSHIDGNGLAYLDDYYEASLASLATYKVTAAANKIRGTEGCLAKDVAPRYVGTDILTITTRDDNPANLSILNAAGQKICGTTACVAKDEVITLSFDKPVVKSSFDVKWLGDESLTFDNLPLNASDLSDTDGSNYISFYNISKVDSSRVGTAIAVNVIALDDENKMNFLIQPKNSMISEGLYKIVFNKHTVKNYIKNDPNGTVFDGDSCIFKVGDYLAPTVVDLTPDSGSVNVESSTTKLEVIFNEGISKGTGIVKLRHAEAEYGASVYAEFDVNSSNVVFLNNVASNNDTIIFTLPGGKMLEDFTTYYVEMPEGFVTDDNAVCAKNPFKGFSAKLGGDGEMLSADWWFRTTDKTAPELISMVVNGDTILDVDGDEVGLFPIPGSTVAKDSKLTMVFDENIKVSNDPNSGVVIYYKNGDEGSFGNAVEFIPWSALLNTSSSDYDFDLSTNGSIVLQGSDKYNGLDSNVVVIDPVQDFQANGIYYVRVNGDAVKDYSGNTWSSSPNVHLDEVKDTEWWFGVANDVAPVLVATDPAYDGVNTPRVYVTLGEGEADYGFVKADLSMTFYDETIANGGKPLNVAKGDSLRKVRIFEYTYDATTAQYKANPWLVLPITDPSITVEGSVVTIHDVILRDGINANGNSVVTDSVYYVTVDAGAILNGFSESETYWAGITNGFRWRFQTADDTVFVPGYDIVSPNIADDDSLATDLTIEAAKDLIVEFEEAIKADANPTGKVQLSDEVGLVHEFIVTAAMCNGKTLTVPAGAYLKDETAYRVVVQAGAFNDGSTAGNPNFGFGDVGVWEFITGDNTNPAPVITPDSCIASNVTFKLTYNESKGITAGSGSIKVTKGSEMVAEFDVDDVFTADSTGSISQVGTISLEGLKDTTTYTLTIPAEFVFDNDETPLASEEIVWNFTTADNTLPTAKVVTPVLAVTADTIVTIEFSEKVTAVAGKFVTIGGTKYSTSLFETVDNITYTVAVAKLPSEVDCPVTFEKGAFVDVNAGCTPNGIADGFTTTFKVADISSPVAIGSPFVAHDYVGLEIMLDFNDAVTKATGNVKIYDAENDSLIETIAASKFTAVSDSVYTYETENVRFGEYYVLMDAGSFVDNGAIEGFRQSVAIVKGEWDLVVSDTEFDCAGEIVYPTRGLTNVPLDTTIVISFCDERILVGTKPERFVTIADQSLEEDYIYYSVVDSMIDGDKLSIAVSGLKENTTYSIIIAPGAITDEAGNEFVGIIDANTWFFTTGDFSVPVVTVTPDTVYNNAAGKVTITSTEAGFVYFAQENVIATQQALLAAVQNDLAVAATIAANGSAELSTKGLTVGNYKAYAIDATGSVGVAENIVVVIDDILPITKISAIQGTAAASLLDGQIVRTQGTVTAIDKNGFYMQDANAAWSGVYVYSTQYAGEVSIGNSVQLVATVDEYNGLTELTSVSSLEFISKVITPAAIVIPATEALSEKYESVLVTVVGRATDAYSGTADWSVKTGSQTIAINNYIYGTYSSLKDYNYQVTGVVYPKNDTYKVEPRIVGDIVNLSQRDGVEDLASQVKVYPNPFDKFISLSVSSDVVITKAVITNIAGQLVKEVINPSNSISTTELRSGVYFISLHTVDGIAKTERIIKR